MASTYNGKSLKLKYLFTAFFEDGTVIEQTSQDKSIVEPLKSAFYDVLEYEKKSPLKSFLLTHYDNVENYVLVNLKDGTFNVNGQPIEIADQNFLPETPFKLIYFRETRIEIDLSKQVGKEDEAKEERFYINRFFIGWQSTWKNQNYQRTIAVNGK